MLHVSSNNKLNQWLVNIAILCMDQSHCRGQILGHIKKIFSFSSSWLLIFNAVGSYLILLICYAMNSNYARKLDDLYQLYMAICGIKNLDTGKDEELKINFMWPYCDFL